jgi:hypothetical protein
VNQRDDERLAQLHAALVERIEGLVTGDDWTAFLTQSRRFHHYSPTNQALIAAQLLARGADPAAGYVASYRTWQRIPAEGGGTCQVRRGETALWVYAPLTVTRREVDDATGEERVVAAGIRGFKAVPVFHQSQLHRPPAITEPSLPQLLRGEDAPQKVWTAIHDELVAAGYTVTLVERAAGVEWNGQTDFARHEVRVCDDLTSSQRIKTAAHEWGHTTMHESGDVAGVRRQIAEVEAESVAFMLCATVDIDAATYTIPYVAGWSQGDVDVVRSSAERVLTATARLVDRLQQRLGVTLAPDPLGPARGEPVTQLRTPVCGFPLRDPDPDPMVADHPALQRLVARTAPALMSAERVELAGHPSPQRMAALMAEAGLDADQAVSSLAALGIPSEVARSALTVITPFGELDVPPAPLYQPDDVSAAISRLYGIGGPRPLGRNDPVVGRPTEGLGLALIDQWARLQAMQPEPALVPRRPFA